MSVELMISGRCEGCPGRDLEILDYEDGSCEVRCRNLELCQHIERHIVENPPREDYGAWRFV